MRTIKNPDSEIVKEVKAALKKTGGYCPCSIERTPETKCMCKDFRESRELGECHCGLYVKVEE